MTMEELNAIKAKMKYQLYNREIADDSKDIKIVVGMGTCGIAAGARAVLDAFLDEVTARDIDHVKVMQSGCLGECKAEPVAEVYIPGKEKVVYGNLTADAAKAIVAEHVVGGKPVAKFVL